MNAVVSEFNGSQFIRFIIHLILPYMRQPHCIPSLLLHFLAYLLSQTIFSTIAQGSFNLGGMVIVFTLLYISKSSLKASDYAIIKCFPESNFGLNICDPVDRRTIVCGMLRIVKYLSTDLSA